MAMAHFILLLTLFAAVSSASSICEDVLTSTTCGALSAVDEAYEVNPYFKVTDPTLSASHLEDLPGFTRSVVERDHALITPESQVYSPLPGWANTLAAYLITPAIGAHFTMYLASMADNASSAEPLPGVERFVFVVKGEVTLTTHGAYTATLKMNVDSFAYIPPGHRHVLSTSQAATLVVFERRYLEGGDKAPKFFTGRTDQQPNLETPGEHIELGLSPRWSREHNSQVFDLRKLLPATPTYDFNIHVMDFQPGEYLNVKEVHYNQHGLLLLEGRGIYRLGDKWYPVQAGDVIWMAPFVPQWYAALGKTRSRYILYKDTARDPLLHPY